MNSHQYANVHPMTPNDKNTQGKKDKLETKYRNRNRYPQYTISPICQYSSFDTKQDINGKTNSMLLHQKE